MGLFEQLRVFAASEPDRAAKPIAGAGISGLRDRRPMKKLVRPRREIELPTSFRSSHALIIITHELRRDLCHRVGVNYDTDNNRLFRPPSAL